MLPIYNKTNQVIVIFYQTPDWNLLKIDNDADKIKVLNKLSETCVDKPILFVNEILDADIYNANTSNFDLFRDKVIGHIISAEVDESDFSLKISGRIFSKNLLELTKTESGDYEYSNSCFVINSPKAMEVMLISADLEQRIEELKKQDNIDGDDNYDIS